MREPVEIIEYQRPFTLTLRDIAAVLFRHRRLLLISFIAILVAVLLSGVLSPTYKAEMKILVRRERVDPVVTSQPNAPSQVFQEEITESELNSEVELLNSQDLLRKVVLADWPARETEFWRIFWDSGQASSNRKSCAAAGKETEGRTITQDQCDFRQLRIVRP